MQKEKLSLIIPVYNEEESLRNLIKKVLEVKLPLEREIIIVDDCSKDDSYKIALELSEKNKRIKLIKHGKNIGKGGAIRTGLKNVGGTIIGIQDADLEYNPKEYSKLIKPILENKTKIVYGSRFLGKKGSQGSFIFYMGNRALSWTTGLLYGQKITDMETCYKFYRRELLKKIKLKSDGFDIEPEITAKFLKCGYKILEVPITYLPRTKKDGKKIKVKDGFVALWVLLKQKFERINY